MKPGSIVAIEEGAEDELDTLNAAPELDAAAEFLVNEERIIELDAAPDSGERTDELRAAERECIVLARAAN